MKITDIHRIVILTSGNAHRRLSMDAGLPGPQPRINWSDDQNLPVCVYQPRSCALVFNTRKALVMLESEVVDSVKDAMAMCGCFRQYQRDKLAWSHSQNKGRLPVPALAMQGTPKWRSIRAKL